MSEEYTERERENWEEEEEAGETKGTGRALSDCMHASIPPPHSSGVML